MLKVACSGPGVRRTRNLSVTSPILYHYTTAPVLCTPQHWSSMAGLLHLKQTAMCGWALRLDILSQNHLPLSRFIVHSTETIKSSSIGRLKYCPLKGFKFHHRQPSPAAESIKQSINLSERHHLQVLVHENEIKPRSGQN